MTLNRVWLTLPNIPSSASAFFLFKHCIQLFLQTCCCWWVPCDASEVKIFFWGWLALEIQLFKTAEWMGRGFAHLKLTCWWSSKEWWSNTVLIYWSSALMRGRVMQGSKAGKIYLNLSPKPWLYCGQCGLVLLCFVETSQEPVWQCCSGTRWNKF